MSDRDRENMTGHPSDYGSRTIDDAEQEQRTADGEPRFDRGSADSAISHDAQDVRDERTVRSDDLQGDTDFEGTNASP